MNEDISIAVKTMLNSTKFNGCYVYGDTSVGKTYTIEKLLGDKAIFITSHITPLALYMLLYKHKYDTIVLDDLDSLNDSVIAILKAALWEINGERKLNWLTTAKQLIEEDVPNEFVFEGKVIITCNNEKHHAKFEPLLARMFVVNPVLTKTEFGEICSKIFEDYGLATFEAFKNNYLNAYTDGLHLRNVLKYCEYTKNGYEQQANELFTPNEQFHFLEVSQVSSVSHLQFLFCNRFGVGRATFYRCWKKYKKIKAKGW